jgi:hypothetical protein
MQQKATQHLKVIKNYIWVTSYGLFTIYNVVFQKFISRIRFFSLKEFIYYLLIGYSILLAGAGWRSYEIIINEEVNRHTIVSNDFLVFFTCYFIMIIPAILKFFRKFESSLVNKSSFITGLTLITIFYIMNLVDPARISATPIAAFTIWFYLFGVNIILLWILGTWIMGVPGISSMPSTRLKN